jgi:hypothetical protein
MSIDRGRLGWGVFFVTLGLVPLAVRFGWVDPAWFNDIWRLWPIILIGIGVGLLLRRTAFAALGNVIVGLTFGLMIGGALAVPLNAGISCLPGAADASNPTTQSGTFAGSSAEVDVAFPCGEVLIGTTPGTGWTVSATGKAAADVNVQSGPDRLEVDRSSKAAFWNGTDDARVQVDLPTQPQMGLSIDVSAGSATADLAGAHLSGLSMSVNAGEGVARLAEAVVDGLSFSVNAGSADVTLPASAFSGSASVNAGSLALCVPEGTAVRVSSSSALGSVDVGPGFSREGDAWVTSAWTTNGGGSEMSLSVNLGSAAIRVGGCQ